MAGHLELAAFGSRAGPEAARQVQMPRHLPGLSQSPISLVAGPILTKEEGRKSWVSRKREEARYVTHLRTSRTVVTPMLGSGNL